MSHQDGDQVLKFVWGLVSGVVLSFLFIRFGFELPGAIGLEQKLISGAISKTAEWEVTNPSLDPLSRRRALAVILANQPDVFLEIDSAIDNQFFNEYLRRNHPNQTQLRPSLISPDQPEAIPPTLVGLPTNPESLASLLKKEGKLIIGGTPSLLIREQSVEARLRKELPDAPREVIAYLLEHQELSEQLLAR